jgi:hypothetical protein
MTGTLVGHFQNSNDAQRAVEALEQNGFSSDEVSYVAHDGSGQFADTGDPGKSGGANTAKGAAIGSVSGVLLGLAALAVPGVGPILAAGPLAAALVGAGVGAATGGLLGALADMGVPPEKAHEYSNLLQSGGTLVLVRVSPDTYSRAHAVLKQQQALELNYHGEAIGEPQGFDPERPHSDAANYGSNGGSSQWGQTVLTSEGLHERTVSRDRRPGDRD